MLHLPLVSMWRSSKEGEVGTCSCSAAYVHRTQALLLLRGLPWLHAADIISLRDVQTDGGITSFEN